jgi:hypothetical protein
MEKFFFISLAVFSAQQKSSVPQEKQISCGANEDISFNILAE